MNTKIENYIKDLEYKDKVINYLKNIYKIEVGEEAIIPEAYINDKIDDKNDIVETNISFEEKVKSMNLPDPNDKTLKQKILKLKKEGDTKFLFRSLDLSKYANRGITVELLKKIIDVLKVLRSVEWIDLRNNNLDDSYTQLIIELLSIDTLKRIDLSYNNLNKIAGKKIANILKQTKHLEYFDISFNPLKDENVCISLCNAVRFHTNLYHFGISDVSKDSGLKLINYKPDIRSINLDDSKYKKKTYDMFYKIMSDKKYSLAVLSLRFNTIDLLALNGIEKGLKVNKTLIYLNLYNCGLTDIAGEKIFKAIENNKTLINLDIGKNLLSIRSCKAISNLLKINNIITKIDLTKNYLITNDNFTLILEAIVNNSTISDLGKLSDSKIGIRLRESADSILKLNKKYTNNKINIDINKSQKMDTWRSIENGIFDNSKKEKIETLAKIENDIKSEDIHKKYDIFEMIDEFDFFNFN